jgi:hypothetical protein
MHYFPLSLPHEIKHLAAMHVPREVFLNPKRGETTGDQGEQYTVVISPVNLDPHTFESVSVVRGGCL